MTQYGSGRGPKMSYKVVKKHIYGTSIGWCGSQAQLKTLSDVLDRNNEENKNTIIKVEVSTNTIITSKDFQTSNDKR